jgi:hypothetical protein
MSPLSIVPGPASVTEYVRHPEKMQLSCSLPKLSLDRPDNTYAGSAGFQGETAGSGAGTGGGAAEPLSAGPRAACRARAGCHLNSLQKLFVAGTTAVSCTYVAQLVALLLQTLLASTTGDGDAAEAAALDLLHNDATMELLAEVLHLICRYQIITQYLKWSYVRVYASCRACNLQQDRAKAHREWLYQSLWNRASDQRNCVMPCHAIGRLYVLDPGWATEN